MSWSARISLSRHEVPRDLGCRVRSGGLGDGACCVTGMHCASERVGSGRPSPSAVVILRDGPLVTFVQFSVDPDGDIAPVDRGEDNLVTSKTKAPAK